MTFENILFVYCQAKETRFVGRIAHIFNSKVMLIEGTLDCQSSYYFILNNIGSQINLLCDLC